MPLDNSTPTVLDELYLLVDNLDRQMPEGFDWNFNTVLIEQVYKCGSAGCAMGLWAFTNGHADAELPGRLFDEKFDEILDPQWVANWLWNYEAYGVACHADVTSQMVATALRKRLREIA